MFEINAKMSINLSVVLNLTESTIISPSKYINLFGFGNISRFLTSIYKWVNVGWATWINWLFLSMMIKGYTLLVPFTLAELEHVSKLRFVSLHGKQYQFYVRDNFLTKNDSIHIFRLLLLVLLIWSFESYTCQHFSYANVL